MVFKTQPIAPLETIYEESGSFISSAADTEHRLNYGGHMNETINGLISARSIPSVSFQRQRIHENQYKPPIEVRFRDGSKRYIHPSTNVAAMIMNRRKFLDSSQNNLSSNIRTNTNYRQLFNNNANKRTLQSKVPLVITIITAEDLNQAGITPTISSSSDDSEIQAFASAQSKPLTDHMKAMHDVDQDSLETLSVISSQSSSQTIVNSSVFNPRSPTSHIECLQYRKQTPMIRSQTTSTSSSSSQTSFMSANQSALLPTKLPSVSNVKASTLAVKIPSNNDETSKKVPLNTNLINKVSTKTYAQETVNHNHLPNTQLLTGSGSRSAFRPFHKFVTLNAQSTTNAFQVPSSTNEKFKSLPQNPNQTVPLCQFTRKQRPSLTSANLSNGSRQLQPRNIDSLTSKRPYDTVILRKPVSDTVANQSRTLTSLIQTNSSNVKKDSFHALKSQTNATDTNLFVAPNINNVSKSSEQTGPSTVDPNVKWLNVASNSIRDIPQLSTKYSAVPIRVTLPVMTPTHNQKLIAKHDVALENRLLNAGLSPETVALYERILNIAEDPQLSVLSPTKILTDQSHAHFT